MEIAIAKSIHVIGMAIWLGMVAIEGYCWKLFFDADDPRERYAVLAFGNQLRIYQEIPAIAVTLGAGLWLASIYGFGALWAQPWFMVKMGCLIVVMVEEVTVTVAWVSLQRRYQRAEQIDAPLEAYTSRFMNRLFVAALPATAAIGTLLIVAVFREIPVHALLVLAAFIFVKHLLGMSMVQGSAAGRRLAEMRETAPASDGR